MERLLVLELTSAGCAVEARLNGVPVASLGAGGGATSLAVHEYTLAGRNHLAIVVAPQPAGMVAPSQPKVAVGTTWARARLVLVRQGRSPADPTARTLGMVEWAIAEGRSYDTPSTHAKDVDLPVTFPRWRFLDAPPVTLNAGVQRTVLEFLQQIAVELARGNPDPLIAASSLRFDELALAYQTDAALLIERFRAHVQRLYAAASLKLPPPVAEALVLRPLLDGRLVECLSPTGAPVLATQNDAPELGDHAWPVRVGMVEGSIYVLR